MANRKGIILFVSASLIAGLALFLFQGGGQRINGAINEQRSIRAVRQLIERESGIPLSHYVFGAKPIGDSSWLVRAGIKGLPVKGTTYLVDHEWQAHTVNAENLGKIMRHEFRPRRSEIFPSLFIERFLHLLYDEAYEVVGSSSDIPGYSENPPKDKLPKTIHPPQNQDPKKLTFFTYQQIGGVLRLNEFSYDKDGSFEQAKVMELARGIGAAMYYE